MRDMWGRLRKVALITAGCALLVLGLSGCKMNQQGANLLDQTPGMYKGTPVAQLSPQTLAELAKRAKYEEFYNHGGPK